MLSIRIDRTTAEITSSLPAIEIYSHPITFFSKPPIKKEALPYAAPGFKIAVRYLKHEVRTQRPLAGYVKREMTYRLAHFAQPSHSAISVSVGSNTGCACVFLLDRQVLVFVRDALAISRSLARAA